MTDLNIWVGLAIGILIGAVIIYLWMKGAWVTKSSYQKTLEELNITSQTLAVMQQKLEHQQGVVAQLQTSHNEQITSINQLNTEKQQIQDLYSKSKASAEALQTRLTEQVSELEYKDQKIEKLQAAILELRGEKASLKAQNQNLIERQNELATQIKALNEKAHLEFEKIASEILKERTERFTATNKSNLDALLSPLGENIEGFKKLIRETHLQESKDRTALETKITELIKQTNQVSEQANNLATALKGQVKKQGNWGEMILESILEQSGLKKDQQYFLQSTIKESTGKQLRPDVLIKLPGSRTIIIDSKVSLLAYDRYVAADTKEAQQAAIKEHLKSMYQHIEELQSKNYDQLEESLDFTMLFVPIEPAYLLGIQEDPALWSYAYSRRILLISPTNLIACLKLMDDLWKREMQSRSAMDIVKQGEKIYEKLVGFTTSMQSIGDQLNKVQTTYQKAFNQMKTGRGNLIEQAIRLKSMGLKSSRTFPKDIIESATEEEQVRLEAKSLSQDENNEAS